MENGSPPVEDPDSNDPWTQDNPMNFQIETTNEFSIEASPPEVVEPTVREIQAEHVAPNMSRTSEASEKSTSSANAKQYWINQLVDVDDHSTLDWIDSDNPSDFLPPPDIQFEDLHNFADETLVTKPELNDSTRVLTVNQVRTLEQCLLTNYEVESQKFPTIRVPPCYMIKRVIDAIRSQIPEVEVKSIRIMGGFSSYVMCHKFRYNDLDILFHLEFPLEKRLAIFEKIRGLILQELAQLAKIVEPDLRNQKLNFSELAAGYIQKSVVIPLAHETEIKDDEDCWSLVCLRNLQGRNLEFKFLKSLKRNFEFSTDSFQLLLDEDYISRLCRIVNLVEPLKQYENEKKKDSTEINQTSSEIRLDPAADAEKFADLPWVLPQVKVVCLYHSFDDALNHLHQFKIEIYNPESLRGGGLLKYCYLRSIGFSDLNEDETSRNKSICSMICRFLITCHDPDIQYNHISKYLQTHFPTHHRDRILYLIELRRVAELCSLQNVQLVKNLIDIANRLMEITEEEINRMNHHHHQQIGWPPRDRRYPHPHGMRPDARMAYTAGPRTWSMQPVHYPIPQARTGFQRGGGIYSVTKPHHATYQMAPPQMNRNFPVMQPAQNRRTPPLPQRHQEEMQHHFRHQQGYGHNGINYQRNGRPYNNDVRNAPNHSRDREVFRRRK